MKGKIICKSATGSDIDFIRRFKELILSTNHSDPRVRKTRKVLLITAAWRTSEFHEQHLKKTFNEIGIPSIYQSGFDVNIQNLSIYHLFKEFQEKCPDLYRIYHKKQETIKKIKQFYKAKNAELLSAYWKQVELMHRFYPDMELSEILSYKDDEENVSLHKMKSSEVEKLYFCRQIRNTLDNIILHDEQMVNVISDIERHFFHYSQVKKNKVYCDIRSALKRWILSANSIFILNGHIAILLNRLRFFGLRETMIEALHRGTNFFTIGTGAEILCRRALLLNKSDESLPNGDYFEFFDNGFGLLNTVQILPQDVSQIAIDNKELRTHIANRFNSHTCVCMDRSSYLFVENQVDDEQDRHEQRYIAVGESDYLYIFTKDGRLDKKRAGEPIFPDDEIKGFTRLIARDTSPQLCDLLKRVHHLDKIGSQTDIHRIAQEFIQEKNSPLKDDLTSTFFYYTSERSVQSVYLASSLGYGGGNNIFYQYKNTGIFYLPMEFSPVSRLEYKFVLNYKNGSHREILDPYNSHRASSPFGVNSVMTTLDYQPSLATFSPDKNSPNKKIAGHLQEIVFKSKIMGDRRRFKIHIPAGFSESGSKCGRGWEKGLPLVIFHDGYDYLTYSYLQNILDNMFHQQVVSPFFSVLSHPKNRIEEYGSSPKYAKFLTHELIPEVEKRYPILPGSENRCSVGASLGGLLSIYLIDTYPDVFGKAISQSGSFFMHKDGFKSLAEKHPRISKFVANFTRFPRKSAPKIVLTCGRFESLIYMNRIMVEALDRLNYDCYYYEYNDGHTWAGWGDTLPASLVHLFGKPSETISEDGLIVPAGLIGFSGENESAESADYAD
ncbi:MAG: hypothetical protein B6244_02765 [Candidatus Cloacimonetes bacterium 4572_55]|nr:MAG: hypothetical protein B6244_02765 [Candidatus Cloacimonetes bacterium 4572_55]